MDELKKKFVEYVFMEIYMGSLKNGRLRRTVNEWFFLKIVIKILNGITSQL